MSARDAILTELRRGARPPSAPAGYSPTHIKNPQAQFIAKARAAFAQVHEIGPLDAVPEAVLKILSETASPLRLHMPETSPLRPLAWHRVPALTLVATPPSGDDAALSAANYAIAETGTLAFAASISRPASWHFLPGREIVALRQRDHRVDGAMRSIADRIALH